MVPSIEQHVEWISGCIEHMRKHELGRIEAEVTAETDWVNHVNDIGDKTLRATCQSWYFGSNIPGKPRVILPYAGGFPAYAKKCDMVADGGYSGFSLR